MSEKIRQHTIGVDSGTVWVGDPCTIIARTLDAVGMARDDPKRRMAWMQFIEDAPYDLPEHTLCKDVWGGVVLRTLHGDGGYPLLVSQDKHEMNTRFTVLFDDFDPDWPDG